MRQHEGVCLEGLAALSVACIGLVRVSVHRLGRVRGAGKLKHASELDQLTDEGVCVGKVVDVVVLELEERGNLRLLVDDDRKH